ncbi:GH1 family beta-glucosidase [Aquabacterium sp. OR-4]|uniref:GH1 family beta-glucosidase n=1 Tax=Aquabacterium sp. OR-4 TaxID=2978127 RepID=UPI0021B36DC1|nr:GH1 family beta-glucosidase [Aquabacterium sp. OR-4]MDT7838133.1 GH1 family beta-glucosidase [Aquabacterium sp. OR-4]
MSPIAPLPTQAFPADFIWGVATAAFQIEGAATADGKGPSVWDSFCRQPGAIADASNGDVACDHYHRLEADLDLIASLGVNSYRFSVSWPRVQPLGQGAWNPAGLDFYERLVDGLLARGLQAHLTLNHWDLPQALQQQGGWMHRDTVQHFVDYARGIQARLGDRLSTLATHNEPWVMATLGHETGIFAPGVKSRRSASAVAHHLLLSHGLSLQALRADGARARLGIVLNQSPVQPATPSAEDAAAARLEDGKLVRWYMDPLLKGAYPEDVLAWLGDDGPPVQAGDLAAIAQPLDWLGLNYYSRAVVSASGAWDARQGGLPLTEMGWEIYPQGLTELLLRLKRDYAVPPLVITENGGAFPDATWHDGELADDDRCAYLASHIGAVGDALAAGVPMAGYIVWSLMDNFEWASGYAKRFGIVHVDYQSLARTPKRSARWLSAFMARQRLLAARG